MIATKLRPQGYDYILDNLREQKDKIDRAIQALEDLRDSTMPAAVILQNGANIPRGETDGYQGMQFIDAVRALLAKTDGSLTTSQVTEGLLGGGFSSGSQTPKKVIAAQLHRYAGDGESGIVKAARGLWKLNRQKLRSS